MLAVGGGACDGRLPIFKKSQLPHPESRRDAAHGKGIKGEVYRYFAGDLGRTKRELASQHAIENAGRHLRGPR